MRDDDFLTWLDAYLLKNEGRSPSIAIENQERRGQESVVVNQILPKKTNFHRVPRDVLMKGVKRSMSFDTQFEIENRNNIAYTRRKYEELGITIIDDHDDLFYNVELPIGWKVEATDHIMWNKLINDKNEEVAKFFYKAAFYDRDAFINFKED